jgi:thioredoxin-related protein
LLIAEVVTPYSRLTNHTLRKFFYMKYLLLFVLVFSCLCGAHAADSTRLYHPEANAVKDIAAAVAQARQAKKHVLIQAGGNWCSWCIRFNQLVTGDRQLDSAIRAGYIVYHLNYSRENTNDGVFARYGFPQRFGFPVFIILDGKGNRLHTQNSALLEEGKGYNKNKVLEFLNGWAPHALDPAQYKKS